MPLPEQTARSKPPGRAWIVVAGAVAVLAAALSFYNGGVYGVIAGVTALAVLVPLAMLFLSVRSTLDETRIARQSVESQRREGERNQAAILRLLDEIAGLGTGDLTATATVTEDITGAIADSVNIAVESLRGLVTTINQSVGTAGRRHPADAGTGTASGPFLQCAVAPDCRGHRIHQLDGRFHRGSIRQRRALPPTWRATRWISRTRVARPCVARSTA